MVGLTVGIAVFVFADGEKVGTPVGMTDGLMVDDGVVGEEVGTGLMVILWLVVGAGVLKGSCAEGVKVGDRVFVFLVGAMAGASVVVDRFC